MNIMIVAAAKGDLATAIIVVILIMICILSVKSYAKKLMHGCCGSGDDPVKRDKVSDRDESHYSYEVLLTVEGMTCSNCAARVENALNALEGVWAKVKLSKKVADVKMKEEIEEDVLKRAVQRAGYQIVEYKRVK